MNWCWNISSWYWNQTSCAVVHIAEGEAPSMLILGSITSCLHSMRWNVSIVVQIAIQDLNGNCMNINSKMNDSLFDGNTRPDSDNHVARQPELNKPDLNSVRPKPQVSAVPVIVHQVWYADYYVVHSLLAHPWLPAWGVLGRVNLASIPGHSDRQYLQYASTPTIIAFCKRSNTGGGNGLGTRLG